MVVVGGRVVVGGGVVETDGGEGVGGKDVVGEPLGLGAAGEVLLVILGALPSGEFSLG